MKPDKHKNLAINLKNLRDFKGLSLAEFSKELETLSEAEKYRLPMRVTHILRLPSGMTFPYCPSCGVTLEREYQHYCDRCGQCLEWKNFRNAIVVLWSPK